MVQTRYNSIEERLKVHHASYLRVLERLYGLSIKCYKLKQDVHTAVYGIDSGEDSDRCEEFIGIITGDDFVPTSAFTSGWFQSGWLYSSSKVPVVGDSVVLESSDGRRRRFKIESAEALGTTTDVFRRYKLSAVAD